MAIERHKYFICGDYKDNDNVSTCSLFDNGCNDAIKYTGANINTWKMQNNCAKNKKEKKNERFWPKFINA